MPTPDASPMLGLVCYVLAGLAGAVFYLPFRGTKGWAWEHNWLIYAVTGLLLVPWGLLLLVAPSTLRVLAAADPPVLARCLLFGVMWGVGGLTWGLMIRYLGVGLGLAVGAGLCASAGTLLPPLVRGEMAQLLATPSGQVTLLGVTVAVVGIVVTGMAGMSKERELTDAQKRASVAEFDFRRGMVVAVFSGILSAGMAFGLGSGGSIEAAAVAAGTPTVWQGLPVLAVVLLGGFVVNAGWCVYLLGKHASGALFTRPGVPHGRNALLAALAGAVGARSL